jgi:[1-hydroxy-2-(trimethylamino)ethyl]phosphonate dioxygenase
MQSLFDLFEMHGQRLYFGEAISELEHALQAAKLAEDDGAPDSLIVAALLHDVGHLLHGMGEHVADDGIDARHEEAGCAWLSKNFGPTVTEPIRLHVAAKRYLCAVDSSYSANLSPASQLSLRLQGGAMTADEAKAFEQNPHYHDAVRLRHYDDQAKVVGLVVPELGHYRERLQRMMHEHIGR